MVFQPIDIWKSRFKASFLEFKGYLDLLITIEALIHVCILATPGNNNRSPYRKYIELDIHKTLEFASDLMPFEEGEFLDQAYKMLIKK